MPPIVDAVVSGFFMVIWPSWLSVAAESRFGSDAPFRCGRLTGEQRTPQSLNRKEVSTVAVVDVAPFVVFPLVGAVAGRLLSGSAAWALALLPPAAHFGLSVVTGRAEEDFLSYVVPVNLLLLGLAALGLLGGRVLRRRTRTSSS